MEKGNIIAKLNIKDYSKILEQVLSNKPFSEGTKNILLSMLYKIDNSYSDYKKVKVDVPAKKDIQEEIIDLISKCNNIKIIKPKTGREDLKECKTDKKEMCIEAYPNEMTILYSLYRLNDEKYSASENYKIIKPSVDRILNIGRAINISELIRDFDGWSWNINKADIEDISINFLYQTLNLIVEIEKLESMDVVYELEEKIAKLSDEITASEFLKRFYELSIISYLSENNQEKARLIETLENLQSELKKIANKKLYLEQITLKKREIQKKIKEIDILLNDDMLLKKAYIDTNKELSPEERIFSLSDFSEIQEEKRKKLVDLLEENNKMQDPINYIKVKSRTRGQNKSIKRNQFRRL